MHLGQAVLLALLASPQQMVKESVNTDAFLTKYDAEGTHALDAHELVHLLKMSVWVLLTDLLGNTFVAGYTRGELTGTANVGGLDAFLVKFSRFRQESFGADSLVRWG